MPVKKEPPVVLCIEDEAPIADVIRYSLSYHGFKVLTAVSAAEGIEIARSHGPDLILLDLILPDINGYSFFDLLQECELSYIPVIIVSGCTSSEAQALGLRLGARDYITKPFTVMELISRVQYAVASGGVKNSAKAARPLVTGE